MILLDDLELMRAPLNTDGVYHADVQQKNHTVVKVLLNGLEVQGVTFCDTNKGILIKTKQSIDNTLVISNGQIVYEVKFGKVEVVHDMARNKTD